MKKYVSRENSTGKKHQEADSVGAKDIDVRTLQLPFYRVQPVAWVDWNAGLKLLAVTRTNATVEVWTYPYWHLATTVVLQRSLSLRKSFIVEKEGKARYLLILTTNSYVIIYDLKNGEFLQHLLHGGEYAFDGDYIPYLEPKETHYSSKPDEVIDDELITRKSSHIFEDTEDILGRLILACNDGCCRHYDLAQNGLLTLKFTTQGKEDPATSCCFVKGIPELKSAFCAGYRSGDIRVFDFKTRQQLTLIVGDKGKDYKSAIWSLQTVKPHFVVSGYSSGHVKFHEIKYGTLVKEFKEHLGDVLALTVSTDGDRVFASGVDSTVVIIGRTTQDIEGVDLVEFKLNSKDRGQSHDIYCLVELHSDLLLSAGHSTDLCLYRLEGEGFRDRRLGQGKIKLRHITSVNSGTHVEYCPKSGLLLINSKQCLDVFTFNSNAGEMDVDYLAKITVDEFGINSVSLSTTAAYFVVITTARCEIFSYNKKRKTLSKITTEFSEQPMKAAVFAGQRLFFISEDNPDVIQNYCLATSKLIKQQITELAMVKSIDIFKVSVEGTRALLVDKLNQSALVVDLSSNKVIDLSGYRKARVMDASLCTATSSVYLVYETNIILKVDSRGNVVYFSSGKTPLELTKLHDRYFCVNNLPNSKHKILLNSLYSFIRLDTRKTYTELETVDESQVFQLESIEEPKDKEGVLKIVKSQRPMLGMVFDQKSSSLLVVRFDWKTAMSDIPHPVITKKFGQ